MTDVQRAIAAATEALANYASADVVRMFRLHRLGKTAAKSECIRQLVPLLTDPEWCYGPFGQVPAAGRALLHAIAQADDATPTAVLAACSVHGVAEVRRQLQNLLEAGLILVRSPPHWGRIDLRYSVEQREMRLFLPPGVAMLVADAGVAPAVAGKPLPEIPDDRVLEVRTGNPAELLRVLRDLALLASRRHLRFTAAGRLGANQVDLVVRELGLNEGELPLALVLDIARTGNVVVVREGRLAPGSAAKGLLVEAPDRVIGRLFDVFVKGGRYMDDLPSNPDEAQYAMTDAGDQCAARRVVMDVVRMTVGPGFSDVEAVVDRVLSLAPGVAASKRDYYHSQSLHEAPTAPYQRAVQREFIRCVLVRTCRAFGLVDVGVLDRTAAVTGRPPMDYRYWGQFDDPYFTRYEREPKKPQWLPTPCGFAVRLTPLGRAVLRGEALSATPVHEETRSLRVGADFEVLAPADRTPIEVLLRLSAFTRAEAGHASDPVKRFRIERTAFLDALRAGLDAEEALAFLAGAATRSVPDNVVRTLRDWAGTYGALTLYSNFDLLEYASPAARGEGLALEKHAFAVGDRFALAPMKPRAANRVIDYESATPPRCLAVDAQGRVTVDSDAADLVIERDLAAITDPVEPPRAWQLTRESLARSGEPAANLLVRLRSRSLSPLPGGVAALVKGACGAVPPLTLANLDVLVVPDPELLRELMERPEVKKEISGTIGPTVATVLPGRRKALDKALAAIGVKTEASR